LEAARVANPKPVQLSATIKINIECFLMSFSFWGRDSYRPEAGARLFHHRIHPAPNQKGLDSNEKSSKSPINRDSLPRGFALLPKGSAVLIFQRIFATAENVFRKFGQFFEVFF
jgi:hypothetical protein